MTRCHGTGGFVAGFRNLRAETVVMRDGNTERVKGMCHTLADMSRVFWHSDKFCYVTYTSKVELHLGVDLTNADHKW